MKRKVCIVFLSVVSLLVYAQGFNAGLMGGFCASQIDGDLFAGYSKPGFAFGAFVNRNISKTKLWQMEIRFIEKGAARYPRLTDPTYYRVRLRYAEVPLVFIWFLKNSIAVEGGANCGYLFSQHQDYSGTGYKPADPKFSNTEISLTGGGRYDPGKRMFLSIRFSYSLIPIMYATSMGGFFRPINKFNNNLVFSLYYRLQNQ